MNDKQIIIFLHLHDPGKRNYDNIKFPFDVMPRVGEYLTTSFNGDWYKVELVVHTPHSREMSAEVYAVKTDDMEEINKHLNI